MTRLSAGYPGISEFWERTSLRFAIDPTGQGLCAVCYFAPEQRDGLLFWCRGEEARIILDREIPDFVVIQLHKDVFYTATMDKWSRRLLLWQPIMGRVHGTETAKPLMDLDHFTNVITFGIVSGQLVLAIGQRSQVTILPISKGAIEDMVHIPEQATALAFAADDMLMIGTNNGVVAVRVGTALE